MIPKSYLEYYKTRHIMVIALGCLFNFENLQDVGLGHY